MSGIVKGKMTSQGQGQGQELNISIPRLPKTWWW